MKMTTLCNIAIFAVLFSKVVHIFFVKFASTRERGKILTSILWTIFKTSEDEFKRKILTEQEEDSNDDFLMDFIRDNHVDVSDVFLSLIDTKMLEDIDVNQKEATESISMKEDTEEEKRKKKRSYRECCKSLGKPCSVHYIASKHALIKGNTEDSTVEEGQKGEEEETPKKIRKGGTQSTIASKYYKSKLRSYRGKSPSESEENNENTEEPVFIPKVPNRNYGNIFITKFEKSMAKKEHVKFLEVHPYDNTSINPESSKLENPGISNTPSNNEKLGNNKPSIEPNVQCEKNQLILHDGNILSEENSEGNIDGTDFEGNYNEEDSQEYTDEEDSDTSEYSSESSHELWRESENEENTDSDKEMYFDILEPEELDNLK
ncbi:hypothetical protein PCYB_131020 [Plasmodium cynomolgi strain B]|uniref:Uncharacterized protein n=1 Tax=Plasmodium cynomolgi (strain B) TaxID=1120755 RepID=K6UM23_PLACD|nr:hypothetical protein PCYB_131020 [Plasmodium cynomolgi strain B]GAB68228.1 hypothetical protein PCYB_131020 [Plasmodium cynomolgi strain B]